MTVGLRVLVAIGAVVAVVAVVVMVPRRLAPRELFESHAQRLGVENEIRRTIIQMLGGAFVLASVFFTYQTVRVSQESLELTARGQITERFTRAIDQIGNARLDVAIGGIYALGQLAQESPTEHVPIMDILATYIHQHSPDGPTEECGRSDIEGDVQAAITVIGSRNDAFDDPGSSIDLKNVNLASGNFSAGNFEGVLFSGSCLADADFHDAQVEGTDFSSRRLEFAKGGIGLDATVLTNANLNQAHAADALFGRVLAWPVDMVGADLAGADLSGARLGRRPGQPTSKVGSAAVSDLSGANLQGADLEAAILGKANLEGVDLRNANLKGAIVTPDQLEEALTDDDTLFPEDKGTWLGDD
jgi:uncharacterized protein YjbI with pentapeptide repeats